MTKEKCKAVIDETRATVSIPEAGEILGIGRNSAYEAANRGEIYTLNFGKRKVVPVPWLKRKLQGEAA